MALPFPIAPSQTDAKSPIDQQLMDAIREDLEYLDTQIGAGGGGGGGGTTDFRVNGSLAPIKSLLPTGAGKNLDGALVASATTFSRARMSIVKGGTSGDLEIDVLRHINVNHPITKIEAQFRGATQSIGRLGSALATQSVTIATPNIATQSISKVKPSLSIRSIVNIGGQNWLVTFTGTGLLDSDYQIGDSILIAGATNALNNGERFITQVNLDGLPSVVLVNGNGVEQLAPAGTGTLSMYSYEYLATVDTNFVVGEQVTFAGHTLSANNGLKTIYAVNSGANNIVTKHTGGATQAGVLGTAACLRWVYSYAAPVDDTQYIVGESALLASHSNANNNGTYVIVRVNEGGNNLYLINTTGVNQAGAAGNVNTHRWIYNTPVDVSADISAGDFVELTSHTSANNNGLFEVKNVNRFAVNNIEIFNTLGVVQAGIVGLITTAKKVVWFDENFATSYVADKSKILLEGIKSQTDNLAIEFPVSEINRGGFTNYNLVIYAEYLTLQGAPAGRVVNELRSIFINRPIISIAQAGQVRNYQFDGNATFEPSPVPADSLLTMDILKIPDGAPTTLILSIS
jgi:hypothetical protein